MLPELELEHGTCVRCGAVGVHVELDCTCPPQYVCDPCWARILDIPLQCLHCNDGACELPGSLGCLDGETLGVTHV